MIENARARRIFLHHHALGPRRRQDLAGLIDRIGFVQLDSINTLARAHDMILFARQDGYQHADLQALHQSRALWEHWTHDASLIPIAAYPYWGDRFDHYRARLQDWADLRAEMARVLDHIGAHGAVTTRDLGGGSKGGWWEWSPSKTALEWLWRVGDLAITARQGFQKSYDLTARVIPDPGRRASRAEVIEWAARTALNNLGFATAREIAAYYDAISVAEARAWAADLRPVQVQGADGSCRSVYAVADDAPPAPAILRLLSPFDPAIRDRARVEFLFGFRYRIEVFVPEARREYGYYVFPILFGDSLIGRIDVKAFRDAGALRVRALWGAFSPAQLRALDDELQRLVAFSGCQRLEYLPDWRRD